MYQCNVTSIVIVGFLTSFLTNPVLKRSPSIDHFSPPSDSSAERQFTLKSTWQIVEQNPLLRFQSVTVCQSVQSREICLAWMFVVLCQCYCKNAPLAVKKRFMTRKNIVRFHYSSKSSAFCTKTCRQSRCEANSTHQIHSILQLTQTVRHVCQFLPNRIHG